MQNERKDATQCPKSLRNLPLTLRAQSAHGLDAALAEAIEQRKSVFQSSGQLLTNHAAWERISSRQKDDI